MNQEYLSYRGRISAIVIFPIITWPVDALAYVDPGVTGMLSQVLYVLFYGALGLFLYFLRSIKQFFANLKQYLAKRFSGRA